MRRVNIKVKRKENVSLLKLEGISLTKRDTHKNDLQLDRIFTGKRGKEVVSLTSYGFEPATFESNSK